MANLPESSTFDANIYQLETTDPVEGGVDGVSNQQAKQLANRTKWLKDQVDALNNLKGKGIAAFSIANNYSGGVQVIYQGNIWVANTTITAGPWNASQWTVQLPTAALFDNDLSLATTEFVQRALGNFSGAVSYSAATVTLTAADVGKAVVVSVASTVTLPAASSAVLGSVLFISATGVGDVVLTRAGSDTIIRNDAVSGSTFTVKAGTSVRLRQGQGGTSWYVLDGDAALPFSSLFAAQFAASGYQKLPSGLIIQWGLGSSPGASGVITFPVAFPNTVLSISGNHAGTVAATAFNVLNFYLSGTPATTINYVQNVNTGFRWIAIGY